MRESTDRSTQNSADPADRCWVCNGLLPKCRVYVRVNHANQQVTLCSQHCLEAFQEDWAAYALLRLKKNKPANQRHGLDGWDGRPRIEHTSTLAGSSLNEGC